MPVNVWKHVNRNLSVSRHSRPVAGTPGFGYEYEAVEEVGVDDVAEGETTLLGEGVVAVVGVVASAAAGARGSLGVMERVMAWTLYNQ